MEKNNEKLRGVGYSRLGMILTHQRRKRSKSMTGKNQDEENESSRGLGFLQDREKLR